MVLHRSYKININTMLDNASETHNVSIPIAAAITAYARIHMSQFKNNIDYNLYYSDTDSIYIDKPLSEDLISETILGKMKLENIITKGIFLSPKVYFLETTDDRIIFKVKGLSHNIVLTYDDFDSLLYKKSFIQKYQDKWIRNLSEGHISILNQLYTLRVTDNKRELIYNSQNKLITTKPYINDDSKNLS